MSKNKYMLIVAILICSIIGFVNVTTVFAANISDDAVTYNGHTYKVFDIGVTWTDAKVYCENQGGHLVTITSQGEQDFVQGLVANGGQNQYWLGATDATPDSNWQWVTGETWGYSNFALGQPDDFRGIEHYLQMYRVIDAPQDTLGTWNDMSVDNSLPDNYSGFGISNIGFVCEWDTTLVSGNPDGTSFSNVTYNGHSFKIFDIGLSWHDAESYCENLGGHLATITSASKQDFIQGLIKDGNKYQYWLGSESENNWGDWKWVTGEAWGYQNWGNGEPDNYRNVEFYVEIYRLPNPVSYQEDALGKWNDMAENNIVDGEENFFSTQNVGIICEWDYITDSTNTAVTTATPTPTAPDNNTDVIPTLSFDNEPVYSIDYSLLNNVTDDASALNAVDIVSKAITSDQKTNSDNIDAIVRFSEHAIENATQINVSDSNVILNQALVTISAANATQLAQQVTQVLQNNQIDLNREVETQIKVNAPTDRASIKVDSSLTQVNVDKFIVGIGDCEVILNQNNVNHNYSIDIAPANVQLEYQNNQLLAAAKSGETVSLSEKLDNAVVIAQPPLPGVPDDKQTVVDGNGNNLGGVVNPNTGKIQTPIRQSATITPKATQQNFTDINNCDTQVKTAIGYLQGKGRINGTGNNKFSPNNKITRAEFTTMLLYALSKDNPNAGTGGFSDVKSSDWFAASAGASKNQNLIMGYDDNTFRPNVSMPREQLIAVSGRVLGQQHRYTAAAASVLSKYSDASAISSWAVTDIARMAKGNFYLGFSDSTFKPQYVMNRGEAAYVIYRVYQQLY